MAALLSIVGPTRPVTEGQPAAFTLKLSEPSTVPQRVSITTSPGTATYGVDYYAPTKQLILFAPGQTTQTVSIATLRDAAGDKMEGRETFTVIATPDNPMLSTRSQAVTIIDATSGSSGASKFQITLKYDSTVTNDLKTNLQLAADRWSSVIVGDLPDVTYNGRRIDDIEIAVTVAPATDLPANLIAMAGYDQRRSGTGGLPYHGQMQINSAYASAPGIVNTLAHEMGHVLGFGSLWRQEAGFKKLVSGIGTSNPIYVGANALREYTAVFGGSSTGVPLYETSATSPPSYDGSYGSHWRDSVFNASNGSSFELMTSHYNVTGTVNGGPVPAVLSRITVGAMQDLGYVVNYANAGQSTLSSNAMAAQAQEASVTPRSTNASPVNWSKVASMVAMQTNSKQETGRGIQAARRAVVFSAL